MSDKMKRYITEHRNRINELDNRETMYYQFESEVRKFMNDLHDNPTGKNYPEFFKERNIPEKELVGKMIDLGIIKRKENIDEPIGGDGRKRSMHTIQYTFSNKGFNDKMHRLYDTFFKDNERIIENKRMEKKKIIRLTEGDVHNIIREVVGQILKEEGEAGGFAGASAGGATNAAGVGNLGSGQYDVPFGGGVQRRKIYGPKKSKKTGDITKQDSNIDMQPALDRTPGKMMMNRKK